MVVIGVGNVYRRDDGAGPAVAARVREVLHQRPDLSVMELDGEPARVIEAWDGADLAVLVDAVHTHTARPGTVHRLVAPAALPAGAAPGTHSLGLGDAYALGAELDRLPARLVVYGIEAEDFSMGTGLSDPVAAAVDDVARAVVADLGAS